MAFISKPYRNFFKKGKRFARSALRASLDPLLERRCIFGDFGHNDFFLFFCSTSIVVGGDGSEEVKKKN